MLAAGLLALAPMGVPGLAIAAPPPGEVGVEDPLETESEDEGEDEPEPEPGPAPPVEDTPPEPTDEDVTTAPSAASVEDVAALRAELDALRGEVAELRRTRSEELRRTRSRRSPSGLLRLHAEPPVTEPGFGPRIAPAHYGLRLTGYIQTQYQWSQLSEDQLQQGGMPLNRDGFAVRRGRLRLSGDWRFVAFAFELDGSTTRGPFVGVRQAHVSGVWRNPDATRPPYMMLTAGLTEVPFGYELRQGQRELLFMERSTGSAALFTGPVDLGLRLRGGVGPFRYDAAVMNGTPIPDFADGSRGIDPTRKPDVAGRLGFDVRPRKLAIAGGASFLTGTGLHPGQDATKNQLQWNDLNENSTFETGEIFSVPGTAALPSIPFQRWAVNADVQLAVQSKLGWSRALGEVTFAQNLDRGLFVADPITAGFNVRHVQAYGAFLQDLTRWAVLGFRYDVYDFNSDLLTRRRGQAVPASAVIHTLSPLVGAVLPAGVMEGIRGRFVFQYDVVLDALGRDARGVPHDVENDQFTFRVQVDF